MAFNIVEAMQQFLRQRRGQGRQPEYMYGGRRGMVGIANDMFLPEIGYQRGIRKQVTPGFLQQASTPGALYGAAATAAEGVSRELFRPGGVVSEGITAARTGQRGIRGGFEPMGGEGAELGVLRSATDQVANAFAQQAGQLENTRFSVYGGFASQAQGGVGQAIADYATQRSGAEQFELARRGSQRRGGLLGLGLGPL